MALASAYQVKPKVVDLTENMANMGLQPLLVVHPYNHIINSIIVARVGFPIASGACRL